jgi:hypothetical protein
MLVGTSCLPTARFRKNCRERALHPARPVTRNRRPVMRNRWHLLTSPHAQPRDPRSRRRPSAAPSMRRPAPLPRPSVSTLTRPAPRRLFRLPSPCVSSLRTHILPIGPGQLETAGQLNDGNCRCRSWSLPIVLLVGCLLHRYKRYYPSYYSPYAARPGYLKNSPTFLLSRRQELAAPGLHGVSGVAAATTSSCIARTAPTSSTSPRW